jgi:hypothetical protein
MPLEHRSSKKALQHNIRAEIHSGRPIKQAVAIGYSEQRQAKKHHMAEGGEAEPEGMDEAEMMLDQCAMECMNAIEMKDKEAFKDAFEVLVVDILHKLSNEMEMKEE